MVLLPVERDAPPLLAQTAPDSPPRSMMHLAAARPRVKQIITGADGAFAYATCGTSGVLEWCWQKYPAGDAYRQV